MFRFIILMAFVGFLLNFTTGPIEQVNSPEITASRPDTVPIRVDETFIEELLEDSKTKTWRDSGYYFQLETVNWLAKRLGTTENGDFIMLASFSSADPSSLQFRGLAVFGFDPDTWPGDITPSKGMRGEALIGFPQDVLLCPSPSQEVGLGQNDPYFPLYLSGEITGVNSVPDKFETTMSVQLRDMEIIL